MLEVAYRTPRWKMEHNVSVYSLVALRSPWIDDLSFSSLPSPSPSGRRWKETLGFLLSSSGQQRRLAELQFGQPRISIHMQSNSSTRMSATCVIMCSQTIDNATFANMPRHFSVSVVRLTSIVQGWRKSGSQPFDHQSQLILLH